MNAFRFLISDLSLNAESQGTGNEYGFLYLLLAYAADLQDANPVDSTYANPYKEVLHRLRSYDGFATQRISQMLSEKAMGQ